MWNDSPIQVRALRSAVGAVTTNDLRRGVEKNRRRGSGGLTGRLRDRRDGRIVLNSNLDLRRPHTVTFDCWATLLYESEETRDPNARARALAAATGASVDAVHDAARAAWREHQIKWHRRVVFGGPEMTRLVLRTLGVSLDSDREVALVTELEDQILDREVLPLEGARAALETLAKQGVRRALICDTGFTPGRVVRRLLDRVGLLEHLEITIFSDEVRVPKPHPKTFRSALDGLGVEARGAVHVGDLRRSDIAGAKASGMGSVRLRARHDDVDAGPSRGSGVIDCATAGCVPACERPEADRVADSFPHLLEILGYA
jgi:putative hydrolase of the HAD superfamily